MVKRVYSIFSLTLIRLTIDLRYTENRHFQEDTWVEHF